MLRFGIKFRTLVIFAATGVLSLILLSACGGESNSAINTATTEATSTSVANTATETIAPEETQTASTIAVIETVGGSTSDIVVYASELPTGALSELDFYDHPASPGGRFIGLPNTGDELDPPPENDPHVTFNIQVQSGVPYRCWIHLKVGTPKGRSQANTIWVQLSDAVDANNQPMLAPGSGSYLTAEGPAQEGWTWVGCDKAGTDSLIYFQKSGEVKVRIQAGSEGVGFDQFLLSSDKFRTSPPSIPIVEK